MKSRVALSVLVVAVTLTALCLAPYALGAPVFQANPTEQQQTTDAIVGQLFTQTAEAEQLMGATQTVQATQGQEENSIRYGDEIKGEITPLNPIAVWAFEGTAGDEVEIVLGGNFDTYMVLYGPNDTIIAENDDDEACIGIGCWGRSRIERTLETSGNYLIQAMSDGPLEDASEYTLILNSGSQMNNGVGEAQATPVPAVSILPSEAMNAIQVQLHLM